jgi:hypothetical protein
MEELLIQILLALVEVFFEALPELGGEAFLGVLSPPQPPLRGKIL